MSHALQKRFLCNLCNYGTDGKSALKDHVNAVHLGLRPYKCDKCNYASADNGSLKRHVRVKHGTQPYPCRDCSSAFEDKADLIKHKIEHHGQKVFRCKKCDFTARYKNQVIKHIRCIHEGLKSYKCDQCPYSAGFLYAVTSHKEVHHGGLRDKRCPHCDYVTFTTGMLNRHIRQVHKIKPTAKLQVPRTTFQQTSKSDCSRSAPEADTMDGSNIDIDGEANEPDNAKCQICGFEAANEDNLTGHILDQHVTC